MSIQELAAPAELARVVICQYCNTPAQLVTGKTIYPTRSDLWGNHLWYCETDQAWVGCHNGSSRPLGILANGELRILKIRVHALLDPLWGKFEKSRSNTLPGKAPFSKSRSGAYRWLAEELGIPAAECHVGMFTNARCREALRILRTRWDLLGWRLPAAER